MNQALWGIDLGGTKIEGIILESIEEPHPLVRTRIDTEAAKGYDHIIKRIAGLVRDLEKQSGFRPEKIGIGTPGVLDPRLGTMKNCNTTVLNGKPLQKDLEEILQIPVVLANDANCFALAETHWGIVRQEVPGARVVFGIIMGTGVGGGIVIDGKVWNGLHGIGGEWGHNFLDESGGPCYCGKTGCVETVISGPALERYYQSIGVTEHAPRKANSGAHAHTGPGPVETGRIDLSGIDSKQVDPRSAGYRLRLPEIAARHRQGIDPAATQTIRHLTHFFGKALSVIVNILDPDVIIVGGGVGNLDEIYTAGRESLKKYIFNNRVETPLLKPSLGDSAGVFGAAALMA